jgi:hypothetical protein
MKKIAPNEKSRNGVIIGQLKKNEDVFKFHETFEDVSDH